MPWHLCRKLSDRERNCVFKDALPSEDASKTNAAKKLCVDCARERGETISLHPTAALADPTPKRKRRLNIEPPTTPRGSKTQGTYGSPPVTPNKEVATLIEQLNAWLGESEALENLTPQESQVTDWKKKFQSVTGTLASVRKLYHLVPKQLNTRQDQPLTPAEQEILASLVKRATFDFHGMPSIQVRSHARVRTFIQVPAPVSDFVGEHQMRRKVHLVRDILEWTSKGLQSNIACMQNMLFNRWKPPGCIVMSVPSHGTLQLQSNLSLSESQMRGLRGMLAEWGKNFLHGWRVVKRQRSGLTFLSRDHGPSPNVVATLGNVVFFGFFLFAIA